MFGKRPEFGFSAQAGKGTPPGIGQLQPEVSQLL